MQLGEYAGQSSERRWVKLSIRRSTGGMVPSASKQSAGSNHPIPMNCSRRKNDCHALLMHKAADLPPKLRSKAASYSTLVTVKGFAVLQAKGW